MALSSSYRYQDVSGREPRAVDEQITHRVNELALRKEEKSLGIPYLEFLSESEIFGCIVSHKLLVSRSGGVSSVLECAFGLAMSVREELQNDSPTYIFSARN